MFRAIRRLSLLLVVALSFLSLTCGAETVRGNIDERLGNMQQKIEYNGMTYIERSRTGATLALVIDEDANGLKLFQFIRLLMVDDENKVFSMINIPTDCLIQVTGENEGEIWNMRLADVFQLSKSAEEKCQLIVEAMNRLLGEGFIEDFIAFDLEGGQVLNGGIPLEGSTREKLSAFKAITDAMSTDELNDCYADLGDYVITNMKSGAVMKIADKVDRYERPDTMEMPGSDLETANKIMVFVPDANQLMEIKLAFFYKQSNR